MSDEQPADPADAPTLGEVLHDRHAIARRVSELGAEISERYDGTVPVLVTVLRGATVFCADLTRAMDIPHELDFLALSAWGDATSELQAQVLKDLQVDVHGRDVVLVEDVVDTGLTVRFLERVLAVHEPASLATCTLLDRPHRRIADVDVAFTGFEVPDRFYVGYGFDYRQRWRNLPDLHMLELDDVQRAQLLPA